MAAFLSVLESCAAAAPQGRLVGPCRMSPHVLTCHTAKGLEWPVVVNAHLDFEWRYVAILLARQPPQPIGEPRLGLGAVATRERNPGAHIYHFAPYEPAALKRLMGRFATREVELDRLLRGGAFVGLHSVVRRSLVASVERYSIKDLEPFFGYERPHRPPGAGECG